MTHVVLYSRAGQPLHDQLCDAFLGPNRGWCILDDAFFEVLTMDPGWGPDGRYTRWQLRQAPAGSA